MCVGIPMQVIRHEHGMAECRAEAGIHSIDMSLVGEHPPGTWILVFLGAARRIISEQEARQTAAAIEALAAVQRGENIDHLFADLVDREPQLPDFLRNQPPTPKKTSN